MDDEDLVKIMNKYCEPENEKKRILVHEKIKSDILDNLIQSDKEFMQRLLKFVDENKEK